MDAHGMIDMFGAVSVRSKSPVFLRKHEIHALNRCHQQRRRNANSLHHAYLHQSLFAPFLPLVLFVGLFPQLTLLDQWMKMSIDGCNDDGTLFVVVPFVDHVLSSVHQSVILGRHARAVKSGRHHLFAYLLSTSTYYSCRYTYVHLNGTNGSYFP